jgi:hypothetical protein
MIEPPKWLEESVAAPALQAAAAFQDAMRRQTESVLAPFNSLSVSVGKRFADQYAAIAEAALAQSPLLDAVKKMNENIQINLAVSSDSALAMSVGTQLHDVVSTAAWETFQRLGSAVTEHDPTTQVAPVADQQTAAAVIGFLVVLALATFVIGYPLISIMTWLTHGVASEEKLEWVAGKALTEMVVAAVGWITVIDRWGRDKDDHAT